ncbi:hypothetical protein SRB5_34220 [Streptomyces sp. RB5]|uniref:GH18 domain-containing protein n=1 Tax=Streptomyces smaragdinus TaxID=2585196 RepID=A0A7K0CII5_9ACTN|nr:hypothetical protein [Streptomyces smaragdinus]
MARCVIVLALVVSLPGLSALIALRVAYAGEPAADAVSRGRDAIWLGHAWVDGRRDEGDLARLKRRLAGTGITELYVHSGPLEHDGTLPETAYPRARWLLDSVRRELPGVRVQAYLGDVLVYDAGDRGGLRLADAGTRRAVRASALQVMDAGFDGVHLDLEPMHSGNADFLTLLDDVRPAVRARGGVLSVAAHQIDPLPGLHSVAAALADHPKWWSQAFFGQVARRVDQIAVMSYDTKMPARSLYGGYVAQQTRLALEVTPRDTDLLMGLPFYHDDTWGRDPHSETVAAAVRGVRLGLTRTDPDRERFGTAAYIDFAATEADWSAYRNGWGALGRP